MGEERQIKREEEQRRKLRKLEEAGIREEGGRWRSSRRLGRGRGR